MFKVWLITPRKYLSGEFMQFSEALNQGKESGQDFSILKMDKLTGTYRTIGWCCGPNHNWKELNDSIAISNAGGVQ